MTRLKAALFLLLLWAAIFLPGLGSTELKGEEGRRILPATTMLETGQWLVPYVGGKPFLRKPPLVNWVIAASFRLTGLRNEWTARLPAALCVLALGLTIVGTSGAGWLKVESAFAGALFAMTQAGLLAKARFAGAEIEGIYVPLAGIALVLWMAWWARGVSRWLLWIGPGVFLGLACLAKGPSLHLAFFYVVVVTVLWQAARRSPRPLVSFAREFLHPAHFVGLAIAAGFFAAWAVPYFQTPEARDAVQVWKRQGIDRFTEAEVTLGGYALNVPRALADQLPWVLLAPALVMKLRRKSTSGGEENGAGEFPWRAVTLATAATMLVVLLIPGALPRYVLPLGIALALALAWALEESAATQRRWWQCHRVLAGIIALAAISAPLLAGWPLVAGSAFDIASALRASLAATGVLAVAAIILARRSPAPTLAGLAGSSGALLGAGLLLYATTAVRWINRSDELRPLAAQIDAALPPGTILTIYDPGYQAWIFYLRTPYRYEVTLGAIPRQHAIVLVKGGDKVRRKLAEDRADLVLAQTFRGKGGAEFLLFQSR